MHASKVLVLAVLASALLASVVVNAQQIQCAFPPCDGPVLVQFWGTDSCAAAKSLQTTALPIVASKQPTGQCGKASATFPALLTAAAAKSGLAASSNPLQMAQQLFEHVAAVRTNKPLHTVDAKQSAMLQAKSWLWQCDNFAHSMTFDSWTKSTGCSGNPDVTYIAQTLNCMNTTSSTIMSSGVPSSAMFMCALPTGAIPAPVVPSSNAKAYPGVIDTYVPCPPNKPCGPVYVAEYSNTKCSGTPTRYTSMAPVNTTTGAPVKLDQCYSSMTLFKTIINNIQFHCGTQYYTKAQYSNTCSGTPVTEQRILLDTCFPDGESHSLKYVCAGH